MVISGGFAGLVGIGPLLSYHHQYSIDFPAGLGFAGIGVWLTWKKPSCWHGFWSYFICIS